MNYKNIFVTTVMSFLLTSCGIYNKYEQKVEAPANAFGTTQDITDLLTDNSMAQMSWREFFTDPQLQKLIEQVLANNTDLNSARIAIEKSEASLMTARLDYLPSLYFSPQGTLSKFDTNPWSKTYNLPLQMSMDVDVSYDVYNRLINRGVLDGSSVNTGGSSGSGAGGDTSKVRGEWKTTGGRWWFQLDNGSYLMNSWLHSNGNWYAFDKDGYMMTGWNVVEGQYYYFHGSGQMASSEWVDGYWLSGDGSWSYRFYGSWHADEYGWWYGDSSGWYACNQWQKINGYWYYFDEWGYMVTNRNVGGYWLRADGTCM